MRARLGQHFLINTAKINQIIDALEIEGGDTIIEIGPGHGELTLPLVERGKRVDCKIVAIEKDPCLAEDLRDKIYDLRNGTEIIDGDALKILESFPKSHILNPKSYKIVGNIPYYITGKLLRVLSELNEKPSLAVLTIQKEVALRICATPPQMNLLAAAVQFWSKPEIVSFIPKKDFSPPPGPNLLRRPQNRLRI